MFLSWYYHCISVGFSGKVYYERHEKVGRHVSLLLSTTVLNDKGLLLGFQLSVQIMLVSLF